MLIYAASSLTYWTFVREFYLYSACYILSFGIYSYTNGFNDCSNDLKGVVKMIFWPINKLLSMLKTKRKSIVKILTKFETAFQPDPIMVEHIYLSSDREKLIIVTINNDQIKKDVYFMKIRDTKFSMLTQNKKGIESQNLLIFDGTHTVEAVLDPEHSPLRVSEHLNNLIGGDQAIIEEFLTHQDQKNDSKSTVQNKQNEGNVDGI